MGPLLGAALSFGSSFLSGLFGKSGAKKRAEEEKRAIDEANRINQGRATAMNRDVRIRADLASKKPIVTKSVSGLAHMTHDAIVNGYNPLTVLRAGGLAGYNTTTVTGSTAMDAALAGQHIATFQPLISQTQVPSTGEVLGNALQSGVGTFQNMMSTQQAQQFQADLVQMQLEGSNWNSASNQLFSRSFYTPSSQTSGNTVRIGGGQLSESRENDVLDRLFSPALLGGPNADKAPPMSTKDPTYWEFMGMKVYHDPYTTGAANLEDRYGDDISTVTGPMVGGADLLYNLRFNPAFSKTVGSSLLIMAPGSGARAVVNYLTSGQWSGKTVGPVLRSGKNLSPSSPGMGAFQ